ncbi:DUF262 domain-containing protein [Leadbettera azotonutricia]|uniref:DUF262 domain-containing protein n=1 Tax=Leadbettera azotonutricia (strain ATCC BAA-888 / DSM 13862 / ZAS-9) TaxID=545695 RepID=F5Y7M2_LEAAZ|nr:DUF262 domain-containing protein [Leadbettera azotonutricia]AEF82404.1 conserved hypothetical protein [Leadbettera azotonutricia ZAS-9]
MVANASKISDFLSQNKTQFIIPVYQRNYDWKIEQCKQLLDDLMTIGNNNDIHFIGSIVYLHDSIYTATDIKELVIIDGQQRLTTIMLIYVALYRLAKFLNKNSLFDEINETYLINKYSSSSEKLKLRNTENNDRAFRFLLEDNQSTDYNEYSNIIRNFDYIKDRINENNYEVVLAGLSKLSYVEISLERGKDDPQKIFESINSTGLELSQADLIRNYILMGLKYDEQKYIYNTYWRYIEDHTKYIAKNENKLSDFIRDFLTLENKRIPNKDTVYIEFKKKYDVSTFTELEKNLQNIKNMSTFYNKVINPQFEKDKDIQEELKYINQLESEVTYPFILSVYKDYDAEIINKVTFINVLELIQSFVWRRFITGLPPNALNKIFMNLYEKINKSEYVNSLQISLLQKSGDQKFPTNDEIIEALHGKDIYSIKSKKIHYLFEKLENFENKEKVLIQGNADITIEHIFPQNPDISWRNDLSGEEYDTIKEKYLHTISNLTLSGNNGQLGNMSFLKKKNYPKNGYSDSRLWLNKFLSSINEWNIKQLESRFELTIKRFLKIWKYPDVDISKVLSIGEVNIFQADEPTSKKLDYYILLDEKKTMSSILEMYADVVRQLLDKNMSMFFTTVLAEDIDLTKKENKNNLRSPLQVNENWYIEGNLSHIDKFKRIKEILTTFDLEDELTIKYAE